jgi:cytidyltransferase-like protein
VGSEAVLVKRSEERMSLHVEGHAPVYIPDYPVSLVELRRRVPAASLAPEDKIVFDWSVLGERLVDWRGRGLRIGFTNGCFDLPHRGHVRLLAEGRAACDRLLSVSTATPRRDASRARPVRSIRSKLARRCSPRSKPSIWSSYSRRTRRSS